MKKTEHSSADPVLPRGVATLLHAVSESQRHPGLQLDKLSPPGDQETQKREVAKVCGAARAPELLSALLKRRATMLAAVGAERFRASTTGPLTLHLARASGLENAGVQLHPVYGSAYLPGSGIKGMARAWAETVWLADRDDPAAAWNDIRAVFGWAPRSEEGKPWKPESADELEATSAGSVVFHDAWPADWPRLEPDIVNNHHKRYYEGGDDPGDWDKPEMAYFLSIAAGVVFDFALSPRMAAAGRGSRHMALAREWLQAALVHEGAGAKTNAGYGRFRLENSHREFSSKARHISTHTLELATPAFLAGACQLREDCDLRPATLRGHLRWWWRTMHAAYLSREDLRRLETAIWGDAKNGAALALSVRPEMVVDPKKFDKDQIAKHHGEPNSQGIRYAAYGMDEIRQKKRRQRWYIEPGARWILTLSARRGRVPENGPFIEAGDVLRQGQIALWILCRYGGVGSKARNGFGSFADIEISTIESVQDCKDAGVRLRETASLTGGHSGLSKSSSLDDMLEIEISTPWRKSWFALDQLGCAMQSFARKNKHDERKAALGLPRKIHGPREDPMQHQDFKRHQPPKLLLSAGGHGRVAAPVHYHLAPNADGALILRMTAFPTPVLPDIDTSRKMLTELRNHMKSDMAASLPKPGERVDALLLDETTRKGGWKAKHEPTGLQGPIHNSAEVPDDVAAGQRVTLIVAHANPRDIAFNWPTPEIEARRSRSDNRRRRPNSGPKRPPQRRY